MALSKSRPTLQTLDDRIVPDATMPGLPDGPPTGPPSYSMPSTGLASYDSGSYGNNSYTTPSTGTASYDSGLFGNNSSTGNNSYVLTAPSGSSTGSYSSPLFDGGSGTTANYWSYGNNPYSAMSTGIVSYTDGVADDAKLIADLLKDIYDSRKRIEANNVKIAKFDALIACGKEHEISLSTLRIDLIGTSISAGKEMQRLEALGQVNGPSYANAIQADKDATAAVFANFAKQQALRREIEELVGQRDLVVKKNDRFENMIVEDGAEIERLKAKNPGAVQ